MTEDADPPTGALTEGADAFERGWPRENCPYPPDAEDREAWLAGWDKAAADAASGARRPRPA